MTVTRQVRVVAALVVVAALLAGCGTSSGSSPTTPTTTAPTPNASHTSQAPQVSPSVSPSGSCAEQVLAGLGRAERVGQLLMLGVDAGADPGPAVEQVRRHHLGAITFIGRSYEGVAAVRRTTDRLRAAADVPLLVATDQEGGQVQVLHGPGFTEMPSALDQGSLTTDELQSQAEKWGKQLRAAGVTTDLAPVLDVVPASLGKANQPIGRYDRQYGSTPGVVAREGLAFARGLELAGVLPVVKHFPGLGAVRGNTDVTAPVVDTATGAGSHSLDPFRQAVRDGLPMVMVSSATYTRLDPDRPAMFSPAVITGLLRQDLGFDGVVVSDDMGNAASARAYGSAGRRAVDFVSAGGDVLLTVKATDVPAMVKALTTRIEQDPDFAHLVEGSVRRVLEVKAQAGLLDCAG